MEVFFLTSALMVTAVLLIRFFFKNKLSFLVLYPLWGLVLLRLLLPVNIIESPISIINLANTLNSLNNKEISAPAARQADTSKTFPLNTKNQNINIQGKNIIINKNKETSQITASEEDKEQHEENSDKAKTADEAQNLNSTRVIINPVIIIWIAGSTIFFICVIISNGIFYKKLRMSRKHIYTDNKKIPVYMSDIVSTPCLTGILHPAVYLPLYILNPGNIQSGYLKQILAHEYTHIKHKDHIWALMRIICLGIYWFNPFVWLAAFYSKQDAELACDEAVLKNCNNTEKYNYGKMLIGISQKNSYGKLYIATSLGSSKSNLKERVTMITKKRKIKKCHIALITLFSIILAGCGMTSASTVYINNTSNKVNANPVSVTTGGTIGTKEVKKNPADDERIKAFKTFMEKDILSRPEWRKFKGNAKDLYFSIQYTAENVPCLFVTQHVSEISDNILASRYALVYYYDTGSKSVKFLTYMACSSSGQSVSAKDGLFITTTHHSYHTYNFTSDDNKNKLVKEVVEGYYIFDDTTEKQSDNFTYTRYEWKLPLNDKIIKTDIENTPLDKYAKTTTTKNYDVVKALGFEKKCLFKTPVAYYKNNQKKWKQFYKDGHMQDSYLYGTLSGNIDKTILKSVKKIKDEDFTTAMEQSSIIIDKTRMSYCGRFSGDTALYYLNTANAASAILIYEGYGYYNVYNGTKSRIKNLKSSDEPYDIIGATGMPEFINADFDDDGEEETAFHIADQLYLIDYYYDYSYKDYNIISSHIMGVYSFNKDDARYFTEQACILHDKNPEQPVTEILDKIKHKTGKKNYKSEINTIYSDGYAGYDYVLYGSSLANEYEFGNDNSYNIVVHDGKGKIYMSAGITYNKKGEGQKHNIKLEQELKLDKNKIKISL